MTIRTDLIETADRVFAVDTIHVPPGQPRVRMRVLSGRPVGPEEAIEMLREHAREMAREEGRR